MLKQIKRLDMDEKRYRLFFSYDNVYGIFRSQSSMIAKASTDSEVCELWEHSSAALDDVLKDIMLMRRAGKLKLRVNDVVCVKINGMLSCLRFAGEETSDLECAADNFRQIENFVREEYHKRIEHLHRHSMVLSVLDGRIFRIGDIDVAHSTLFAIGAEVFCADRDAVCGVRSEFSLYSLDQNNKIKNINPYGEPFFSVKNAICYYTATYRRAGEAILLLNRKELELVQDYYELNQMTG